AVLRSNLSRIFLDAPSPCRRRAAAGFDGHRTSNVGTRAIPRGRSFRLPSLVGTPCRSVRKAESCLEPAKTASRQPATVLNRHASEVMSAAAQRVEERPPQHPLVAQAGVVRYNHVPTPPHIRRSDNCELAALDAVGLSLPGQCAEARLCSDQRRL